MASSRGNAISAYNPAFSKGALVYGANIQSGVVTSAHLADGTVVAAELAAGSVTSAKIGTGAVVSVKLGAASVISAKIGTGAVLAANLGAASVTSAKLGVSAISNTNIKANAIRAGAISARAVTSAKMFAAFLSGTVSGLLSGVIAVAHGLGSTPKFAVVSTRISHADVVAGRYVFLSQASAATSTNIYLKATKSGNVNYAAYVQV